MPFVEITTEAYNKLSDKAKLAYRDAENAHLKALAASMPARFTGKLTAKYIAPNSQDAKGNIRKGNTVGIYGLGQWPTSLYGEQWDKVLDYVIDVPATVKAGKLVLSAEFAAERAKCIADTRKNSTAAPVQNAPVQTPPVKANPLAGFSPEQLKALSPEQIVALSA